MARETETNSSDAGQNPSPQDIKHRKARLMVNLIDRDSMLNRFAAPFVREAQKPDHYEDLQVEIERLRTGPNHFEGVELQFYASWNLGKRLLAHLTPPPPRPITPKVKPKLSETDLRPVDHIVRSVIERIVESGIIPSIDIIKQATSLSPDQVERSMDKLRAAGTIKPLNKIAEDIKIARLREAVNRWREASPKRAVDYSIVGKEIGASKNWVKEHLIGNIW